MANPERGEVDLVCGEKIYTLVLSTHALCVMEKSTGKSFGNILAGLMSLNVNDTVDYLKAVLGKHHGKEIAALAQKRKMKPDEVICEIVDEAGMKATKDALVELFKINTPDDDTKPAEGGEANPPDAEDGIGGSSMSTVAASASAPSSSGPSR